MIGYKLAEAEVVTTLISQFSGTLNSANCKADDMDALLAYVRATDPDVTPEGKYACIIKLANITHVEAPKSKNYWQYQITGLFWIQATDLATVDDEAKDVIVLLQNLVLDGTFRGINQSLASLRVVSIDTPVDTMINDIPFYFLPFVILVKDA